MENYWLISNGFLRRGGACILVSEIAVVTTRQPGTVVVYVRGVPEPILFDDFRDEKDCSEAQFQLLQILRTEA